MKILLLGGAGYIGSQMAAYLNDRAIHFITLDKKIRHFQFEYEKQIQGSVSDEALLNELFERNQFDAVLHFAASIDVAESCQYPLAYYENNMASLVVLLGVMVKHKVDKLVFSSTAAVYGQPIKTPIAESHPLVPISPYGCSKMMAEKILQQAESAYGIRSISLRYFNAAGADPLGRVGECHEPETHIIPILLQVASGQRRVFSIYGQDYETPDGTCVRDYIHVLDLCRAHWCALQALFNGAPSAVYNVGLGKGHSIKQLIKVVEKITNKKIMVNHLPRRLGDPAVLVADPALIKEKLAWSPVCLSLEEVVQDAWNWHQSREQS